MDKEELEKYEYQLSQIKLGLAKDPTNAGYLELQEELTSLIELTKQYLVSTQAPEPTPRASTSSSTTTRPPRPTAASLGGTGANASSNIAHVFKSGEEVQARYSGDAKFYPARITSIGGASENRVYSVIFAGYDSPELVTIGDIKPMSEGRKRALAVEVEDEEKEKKKKRNEKKKEALGVKTAEQGERQKSWQSFAKKSTKKGVHIPGIAGDSMFRSPADMTPNAKVGVVGGGRGMTASTKQGRQTFKDSPV